MPASIRSGESRLGRESGTQEANRSRVHTEWNHDRLYQNGRHGAPDSDLHRVVLRVQGIESRPARGPEEKRKFCQNLSTLAAKLDDGLWLSP